MNRLSPFARGMALIAVLAIVIVVLNLQTSLVTASALVSVAFFLAMGLAAYMFWRDFGRREISIWPERAQWVFYGAVALLVVDLGWYFLDRPSGSNLLAFFLVAGACVFAAIRTWRDQHRYS